MLEPGCLLPDVEELQARLDYVREQCPEWQGEAR
jgi:hypothetical protein